MKSKPNIWPRGVIADVGGVIKLRKHLGVWGPEKLGDMELLMSFRNATGITYPITDANVGRIKSIGENLGYKIVLKY